MFPRGCVFSYECVVLQLIRRRTQPRDPSQLSPHPTSHPLAGRLTQQPLYRQNVWHLQRGPSVSFVRLHFSYLPSAKRVCTKGPSGSSCRVVLRACSPLSQAHFCQHLSLAEISGVLLLHLLVTGVTVWGGGPGMLWPSPSYPRVTDNNPRIKHKSERLLISNTPYELLSQSADEITPLEWSVERVCLIQKWWSFLLIDEQWFF